MCGRYLATTDPARLAEHFHVDTVAIVDHRPRYNVAPSTEVYAVIDHHAERRLGRMRWGFLPQWADSPKHGRRPINARIETLGTSRMFGPAFRSRRCLLPADGFYEWEDRGEGRGKQPYHLADPDGRPLALAGVWTTWRDPGDPDAEPIRTTAIITTAAAGAMRRVHDRMPLILPPGLWDPWLDVDDPAPHLLETVAAIGAPRLDATPISTRVNSVRNDGPELLTPARVDDEAPR
jgi:putative SOS response-associated peptidase YedK